MRRRGLRAVIGVVGLVAGMAMAACSTSTAGSGSIDAAGPEPTASATRVTPRPTTTTAPGSVDCDYRRTGSSDGPAVDLPDGDDVRATGTISVTVVTNRGELDVTLDRAAAPCTVNSLLSLADQGFYNGSACSRLSTHPELRVVQCGDPDGTGTGGPGYEFDDELTGDERYTRGVLAMANGMADANGSQFFVVYGDADIDPTFTVFGQVSAASMSVIDAVAAAGVQGGGLDGVPVTSLIIESFAD